jgi:hypothetical protein
MNNLELLLARIDDQHPVLENGLPLESAASAPRPPLGESVDDFRQDGADLNSLAQQRWGVVAPQGPVGDRLLELIAPLRRAREEQQGAPSIVYRAPSNLKNDEASGWWAEAYNDESIDEADRPRYVVMLGDAEVLSWELQQRIAADTFLGRLCFQREAGYESYIDKLLAAEKSPPRGGARALYFTARDGTAATNVGHEGLMEPTLEQSRIGKERGQFSAREIIQIGDGVNISPDDFLASVDTDVASMLFTVSHGCAAPRNGWSNGDEQRRLQGAMGFGAGQKLTAEDLASRKFLPNGLWFYFACFGAGTPQKSAYQDWLEVLRDTGRYGRDINGVWASLPSEKDRPFVAALPQAVLANPNGPLAVLGQVDLAWTFNFHDIVKTNKYRPLRFQDIFRTFVDGKRVGIGAFELRRFFKQTSVDLSAMYDADARQINQNIAAEYDKQRKIRKAALWMLRQDLSTYVLLGDPAARLNVESHSTQQIERTAFDSIETRRPRRRVTDTIRDMPAVRIAEMDQPATPYIALSAAAIDCLADRLSLGRKELEQILASLPLTGFFPSGGENVLSYETADIDEPVSFVEEEPLPWHAYIADSGQPQAGKTISDAIWAGILANRAAIPHEPKLRPHGTGHIYVGIEDKWHMEYLREFFQRKMSSANAAEKRKIEAFWVLQTREGNTATVNSHDNQIVTWGTGWGGLSWMGTVVARALNHQAVRELFGKCGVRYRGRNTYDIVDFRTGKVVTGKKEALEVMRSSLSLLWMLIHASRAPETRDAVTEAQLGTFFISATDIGKAEAIATQALFNFVTHLRHWAPAYAMGCIEWALTQMEPGAPSIERDKRLAVLVGRYFYGKARKFQWIPEWKQFQVYWHHMKLDGLDCLDDPFIQSSAAPTDDPFASGPKTNAAVTNWVSALPTR